MPGYYQFGYYGYFPGASPPPPPPPPPSSGDYFPASYWPRDYFGGGYWGAGTGTVVVSAAGTDHDIYQDIRQRLIDSGVFEPEAVIGYEQVGPASAEWSPMVRVIPGAEPGLDDADPETIVETGSYTLAITVRDEDPTDRHRQLSIACNAARNALNFKSLADLTMPGRTILKSKGKAMTDHPGSTAEMAGEWGRLIDVAAGYYAGD